MQKKIPRHFSTSNICTKRPYNGTDIRLFEKNNWKKSNKSYKLDQSIFENKISNQN